MHQSIRYPTSVSLQQNTNLTSTAPTIVTSTDALRMYQQPSLQSTASSALPTVQQQQQVLPSTSQYVSTSGLPFGGSTFSSTTTTGSALLHNQDMVGHSLGLVPSATVSSTHQQTNVGIAPTPSSVPSTHSLTTTGQHGIANPQQHGMVNVSQHGIQAQNRQLTGQQQYDKENVYQWILELAHPDTRERALHELCKKREEVVDLAPMLWHSFGTIAALLQEIIMIYPLINPTTLTHTQSNRVCNALALLQCVASHVETRSPFLEAQIPMFLYPFLNTNSRTRPYEYLRLTSLGVVGALVKTDEQEVIQFLLSTEIIPLCLRIMENGSDLSKTVATFILQKILQDSTGLTYICHTCERFLHVANTLNQMIQVMAKDPGSTNSRLLKHVIRCYFRLADDARAREALKQHLPEQLKDNTFLPALKDDQPTQACLIQLLQHIQQNQLAGIDSSTVSGPQY